MTDLVPVFAVGIKFVNNGDSEFWSEIGDFDLNIDLSPAFLEILVSGKHLKEMWDIPGIPLHIHILA